MVNDSQATDTYIELSAVKSIYKNIVFVDKTVNTLAIKERHKTLIKITQEKETIDTQLCRISRIM